MTEPVRHVVGTIVVVALHFATIYLFVKRFASGATGAELLALGAMLAVMTIAFEFGFFGAARGVPCEKLVADYNILKGRLFGLVILNALLAPWLSAKLLGRI